jgi:hypothetical protein
MTQLMDSVVLVTGANGGLGTEFVGQALRRGARRVYATARNPRGWQDDRVVPLALDVTDQASVAAGSSSSCHNRSPRCTPSCRLLTLQVAMPERSSPEEHGRESRPVHFPSRECF